MFCVSETEPMPLFSRERTLRCCSTRTTRISHALTARRCTSAESCSRCWERAIKRILLGDDKKNRLGKRAVGAEEFEAEHHGFVGLGGGEVAVTATGDDVLPVGYAGGVEGPFEFGGLGGVHSTVAVAIDDEGRRQAWTDVGEG